MKLIREDIYFIGGGTCSGKSTAAEEIARKTGYFYYKQDDDLFVFLDILASAGDKNALHQKNSSMDGIWLRDPAVQCKEELELYSSMLPLMIEKLNGLPDGRPVITEGVGYLPDVMKQIDVPADRYVCIIPSREFRLREYKKRDWVSWYLDETSNKELAFANWMERDALISEEAAGAAKRLGYSCYLVDGSREAEDTVDFINSVFRLQKQQ